jgi:hypothetical protein
MRKNWDRRFDMNKTFALLLALTAGMPAVAADRTVQGVNFAAVPWATFCPGVKSVGLNTGAGACTVAHPASQKHAAWNDFGMGTKQPPPNCKHAEHEYQWWTTPASNKQRPGRPEQAWGACQEAWRSALNRRAREPEGFAEPFAQWRSHYFGPWLVGEGR